MNDRPRKAKPPIPSPESGKVLGEIPAGEFDNQLEPGAANTNDAAPARAPQSAPAAAKPGKYAGTGAPAGHDRLTLPRGGLVTLRRSGGLRFTSRTVVVYKDGRVTVTGTDMGTKGTAQPAARRLSDEELAELYRVLDAASLPELRLPPAKQSPDAYVYELAARAGNRTASVEAADGSIPQQLAPLIRLLTGLMSNVT